MSVSALTKAGRAVGVIQHAWLDVQARFFCANLLLTCVRRQWRTWDEATHAHITHALR